MNKKILAFLVLGAFCASSFADDLVDSVDPDTSDIPTQSVQKSSTPRLIVVKPAANSTHSSAAVQPKETTAKRHAANNKHNTKASKLDKHSSKRKPSKSQHSKLIQQKSKKKQIQIKNNSKQKQKTTKSKLKQ